MKYDLHVHTTQSDGKENKMALLKTANELGLSYISFTDHNTLDDKSVSALNALYESLYGENQNVKLIEGVEFDVYDFAKMHILGYDIKDKEKVKTKLKEVAYKNDEICTKILSNINNYYGFNYTKEQVLKGMGVQLLNKRILIDWMVKEKHAKDYIESGALFTNKKSPTYERKVSLYSSEILDLIIQSGGIPVLAHPSTLKVSKDDLKKVIAELKDNGLEGIEVLNTSKTTLEQQKYYQELADSYDLLTTSGTDFHNYQKSPNGIGVNNNISNEFVKKLRR